MAKILVVGDLYGKVGIWQNIDDSEFDHVIFMGNHTNELDRDIDASTYDVFRLFQSIVTTAKRNPNKHIALLGPADLKFLPREYYSVLEPLNASKYVHAGTFKSQIERNISAFKVMFQKDNWMFSYGGVTQDWLRNNIRSFVNAGLGLTEEFTSLSTFVNRMFTTDLGDSIITKGTDLDTGPVLTRASDILCDPLKGFNHVVCNIPSPQILVKGKIEDSTAVIFTNTLSSKEGINKFLIIDTTKNTINAVGLKDICYRNTSYSSKLSTNLSD